MAESDNSSNIATGETRASSTAAGVRSPAAHRPTGSTRMLWVVLLTLPVTIAGLAIAIGLFGLLLRLCGY